MLFSDFIPSLQSHHFGHALNFTRARWIAGTQHRKATLASENPDTNKIVSLLVD